MLTYSYRVQRQKQKSARLITFQEPIPLFSLDVLLNEVMTFLHIPIEYHTTRSNDCRTCKGVLTPRRPSKNESFQGKRYTSVA